MLQMTMPGDISFGSNTSYFGRTLIEYTQNGTIPAARVDDMAARIVAAWYFLGQDAPSYPHVNFNAFDLLDDATNAHVDAQGGGVHADLTRKVGAASTVLLKNRGGALPLRCGNGKRGISLALVGSDAGPARIGPNRFADQGGVDGILAMGWGSGCVVFDVGYPGARDIAVQDCQLPLLDLCTCDLQPPGRSLLRTVTPFSRLRRSSLGLVRSARRYPGHSMTTTSLLPGALSDTSRPPSCLSSPIRVRSTLL
jgi:hypothetical protein